MYEGEITLYLDPGDRIYVQTPCVYQGWQPPQPEPANPLVAMHYCNGGTITNSAGSFEILNICPDYETATPDGCKCYASLSGELCGPCPEKLTRITQCRWPSPDESQAVVSKWRCASDPAEPKTESRSHEYITPEYAMTLPLCDSFNIS